MKNLFSFLFAAFAAMVVTSCNNQAEEFENGGVQVSSVARYFEHKEFRPEAEIQGDTLLAFCDNVAHFYQKMSDKTSQNERDVCYVVTNIFRYFIPEFIGDKVMGNTYPVNKDGIATVENKQCSFTFTSCEVEDIVYMGDNYKSEAPQCHADVKSITFNPDSTVTVLLNGEGKTLTGIIPVTYITEEKPVYLLRVDSSFVHNNYVATVEPNGNTLPIISNHTATLEKVMSNGTRADKNPVPYKWVNNYTVSYNQNMTVDDLNSVLGRHAVGSNGSVTVAGYNFTVSFVNRVCDDIMYNGKNYKAYAPICKAKVVAITINKNNLVVEFQGDHDGDNSVIEATLPLTVTENKAEEVPGKIVAGWATDSYESSKDFHYNWHSCTFHVLALNNGVYTVYSRDINATSGWRTTNITSTLATSGKALAYVGTNGEDAVGYIDVAAAQGTWYKIVYNKADGSLDKFLSSTEKAFHKDDDMFQRNPVRGQWSNGKISADGHTLYVTGSED